MVSDLEYIDVEDAADFDDKDHVTVAQMPSVESLKVYRVNGPYVNATHAY